MLTWTLFELYQGPPGMLKEIQNEVRTVLAGKSRPDIDDITTMKKLRFALIEALRLYPEPPLLIRRARTVDTLPGGSSALQEGIKVLRGTDIFISTWNLHRSPDLWENPQVFDPTRYERSFRNPSVVGWQGYDPDKVSGLYPNEQASDFAFLPFGGGARKCVGDQFAMMEAVVTMAIMIKNFDFEFAIPPSEVGMKTGATIHTMNGLMMRAKRVLPNAIPPATDGWWEKQHTQRGLNPKGRPYSQEEIDEKKSHMTTDDSSGKCPFH
jgi:cytochrome P450 family 97 subfamily B polypeptide 3